MSELKPCPFCGEPVYLDKVPLWSSYNGITHGYTGCYEFDVHCRNPKCGCSIKLAKNNTIYSDEKEARLNAIKAWNRRIADIMERNEPQMETEIARAIVHKMIDDAIIAEDAYPDLRQKMHDAVDEYELQTERGKS